jgi:hypothetical protein
MFYIIWWVEKLVFIGKLDIFPLMCAADNENQIMKDMT